MTNNDKQMMIEALLNFRDAHNQLLDGWQNGVDLNDTEAIKLYPFNKSFDELEIAEWVEATIDELGAGPKAKPGIFTPWAIVYCYKCHGPEFNGITKKTLTYNEMMEKDVPVLVTERNAITTCDKCGTEIQIDSSAAGEHNLALKLRYLGVDASLTQTGGMNSACEILKAGEYDLIPDQEYQPHFLVVHDWDGDGMWSLSEFDKYGEHVEESDYQCDTLEQMLGHIMLDVPTKPLEVK